MKRLLIIAVFALSAFTFFEACSPKTTTTETTARRGNVSGNWVLNNITFEGIPEVAVKSFLGEASYKCFIGSTWSLTNSGNGSYSLPSSTSCEAKTQKIFWSVNSADQTFQFKKIYEGEKAKNVTEGYRLNLGSATSDNLIIKSPISYGNGSAYIVLNFTKS